MLRRVLLLGVLLLWLPKAVPASERATLAVLPFGVAGNHARYRWLGTASASSLTEKLRRVPSVRVLATGRTLHEIQAAGVSPDEVAWAPTSIYSPLGRLLEADILVIGSVGRSKDLEMAGAFLGLPESPERLEEAQMWLAARVVDVPTGTVLGRAHVQGREDQIHDLHGALLIRVGEALGLPPDELIGEIVQRTHRPLLKSYKETAKAQAIFFEIHSRQPGRPNDGKVRRGLKAAGKAIDRDPANPMAHALHGAFLDLQNKHEEAASAYERSAALDPYLAAPRYGLADLARRRDDTAAAEKATASIVQARPWDDEGQFLLGTIRLERGDTLRALTAFERSIEFYDHRPEAFYEAGRLYRGLGKRDEAIRFLEEAVDLSPGKTDHHAALVSALLLDGRTDEAQRALTLARELGAAGADLVLLEGRLELQAGRIESAIAILMQAVKMAPERAEAHLTLARAYALQGRLPKSVEAFRKARAMGADLQAIAEELGGSLAAMGQAGAAEAVYREALEGSPDRTDLRLLLIETLISSGRLPDALGELREAVGRSPEDGLLHQRIARIHDQNGERDLAVHHYERAVALGTESSGASEVLAAVYLARGDARRARDAYKRALDLGSKGPEAYSGLGDAEEILGDLKAALAAYRGALKVDPQHPRALSGAARLSAALRPPPRPDPSVHARRGRSLVERGDLRGAESALAKALRLVPDRADLWNDLGTVQARLGKTGDAERAFRKAIDLEPDRPQGPYNLGRLLAAQGGLEEAIEAYRQALQASPAFEPAWINLAAAHLSLNDAASAVSAIQRALDANPDAPSLLVSLANAHLAGEALLEAADAYEAALARDPELCEAHTGLARVALAQGDTADAVRHQRIAVELDPENAAVQLNLVSRPSFFCTNG